MTDVSQFQVRIAEKPGKGRCLLATEAIAEGKIVLISHAWLSCLCPSQASFCCARCLRRRPLHATCVGACRKTRYCSEACRKADEPDHILECEAIPSLETRLRSAGDVVWHNGDAVLNALLLARAARYLASAPSGDAAANLATPFKGKPKALKAMLTSPRLSIPRAIAEATLAVAAEKEGFLPRNMPTTGGLVATPGIRDDIGWLEWLVSLLLQQQVNACGVLDSERFEVTGEGLFVQGALVNHSCAPTCQFMYRWDGPSQRPTQYLIAIRDVSLGEELTIAYRDTERPVWERRNRLQRSHWFTCRCARCEVDVQPSGLRDQGCYVANVGGSILRCLVEATVQSAEEAAAVLRGLQAAGLSVAADGENRQVEAARAIAAGALSSNVNAFRLESETVSRVAKAEAKRSLKSTRTALFELEATVHAEARILIDLRTLAVAQAEACGDAACVVDLTAKLLNGVASAYGGLHPRRLSLLALRSDALACLGPARAEEASAAFAELRGLRARLCVELEEDGEVETNETTFSGPDKADFSSVFALDELD
eukprot:TRINITY_DN68574_c0_g1_i1.p1 TRINITY_DN68574_c0_g1~~TRINITY_DN68574_c0_g1_i1.p1  ORF type:complete len:567 (-),score=89.34 TRINITY_DN68574_c0_g1_i1:81-1706(-)